MRPESAGGPSPEQLGGQETANDAERRIAELEEQKATLERQIEDEWNEVSGRMMLSSEDMAVISDRIRQIERELTELRKDETE
ncbi:hypothetical protein AMJ57_01835 [Parcubacteria bacterium SG8_24]|nr:MAG: hypothetical protein AMJ57_01835 [Parcubacteria bacterium SG8_24]